MIHKTWKPIVFRITFIVILQLMSKLTYHKDRRRLLDISARYSISALVRIFRLISKQASLDKRNLTTINYPFSKDFVREFFKDLSNITFVYHIKNISKPFFILYHNRLIQQ